MERERIFVTYMPVRLSGAKVGYHAALNYVDKHGKHYVVEAEPAGYDDLPKTLMKAYAFFDEEFLSSGTRNRDSKYGTIVAMDRKGEPDDLGRPFENLREAANLSTEWNAIRATAKMVNELGFEYRPRSQNSNTFAFAALRAAGLNASGHASDPNTKKSGSMTCPAGISNCRTRSGARLRIAPLKRRKTTVGVLSRIASANWKGWPVIVAPNTGAVRTPEACRRNFAIASACEVENVVSSRWAKAFHRSIWCRRKLTLSLNPDFPSQRAGEAPKLARIVRQDRHRAPDRLRPGGVAAPARDHMHMQLRHGIAERRDIELVALRDLFQRARRPRDLHHQLRLRHLVEVDDLDGRRPPRHQQQPGIIGIVDDEDARKGQVADIDRVAFELWVQRPGLRIHVDYQAIAGGQR